MHRPLALVFYEKLLPGTQVVNRLHDLKYLVKVLPDAHRLVDHVKEARPLVLIVDLDAVSHNVCEAVAELRGHPDTRHVPVIGFTTRLDDATVAGAAQAGVSLCVGDAAILSHLRQLLDQVLTVE